MHIVLEYIPPHRWYCQETVLLHKSQKIFNFQIADGRQRGGTSQLFWKLTEANIFWFQALTFLSFPMLKWTRNNRKISQKFCVDQSSPLLSSNSRPSSACYLSASWRPFGNPPVCAFSDKFTNLKIANELREMCATPARLSKNELALHIGHDLPFGRHFIHLSAISVRQPSISSFKKPIDSSFVDTKIWGNCEIVLNIY